MSSLLSQPPGQQVARALNVPAQKRLPLLSVVFVDGSSDRLVVFREAAS
ncbi:MAG: hypothetical protein M3511_10105 [Deinococcota bacterium]|jgi:hypothetical protein|nr:hypothetical protein [Deinococcota bacterium]